MIVIMCIIICIITIMIIIIIISSSSNIVLFKYCHTVVCSSASLAHSSSDVSPTPNLRTEILDFREFDSSRIISVRVGILSCSQGTPRK